VNIDAHGTRKKRGYWFLSSPQGQQIVAKTISSRPSRQAHNTHRGWGFFFHPTTPHTAASLAQFPKVADGADDSAGVGRAQRTTSRRRFFDRYTAGAAFVSTS
jgi:hypothetical protein